MQLRYAMRNISSFPQVSRGCDNVQEAGVSCNSECILFEIVSWKLS